MDSIYTYYSQQQQQEQQQQQQQYWQPQPHPYAPQPTAVCPTSFEADMPVFSNPFDPKHPQLSHLVDQPQVFDDALFSAYSYDQQQPSQEQYYAPPVQTSFIDTNLEQQHQAQYYSYAHSPALSDLSSLSGLSNSPLSPIRLLTPMTPNVHPATLGLGLGLGCTDENGSLPITGVTSGMPTMLPPMPLDASLDDHMPIAVQVPELRVPAPSVAGPSSQRTPASTASTGPAPGEFAVLTITGHTIAASSSYRSILSAARSVRKAQESGLDDDTRTCQFCGKVCDRPSTLKTHLNSHTGARPHNCTVPGCDRSFTVLSNMYRHAKACAAQRAREVRKAYAARRV